MNETMTKTGEKPSREAPVLRVPMTRYPGMNPFVLDWLAASPQATRFLERRPQTLTRKRKDLAAARAPLAHALIESNRRWGSFVSDQVGQWAEGRSTTIIGGQQVGFAGGPFYTLAKLASLIRMRDELEARGTPVTVFFWLATEDHDYEEAATLQLPVALLPTDKPGINRQLDLLTLRATRTVESKSVVGPAPVPDALIAQFLSLFDMDRPSWLRPGITFRDSFAELVVEAAGERIVFVDALLPELRRAGAPLFDKMLNIADAMQSELASRSAELEKAGYAPQVTPRPDGRYTLLFRVDPEGDRHLLDAGHRAGDGDLISTSALTRPLLQDFVFDPDVFVGGPSEVAYYAQIVPLHELLGIPMPRVALRGHVLVAAKRAVRLFDRYGIGVHEVFGPPDAFLASREAPGVEEINAIAEEARGQLAEQLTRIGDIALPADHALARAISRSTGHLEYHFDKLVERAVRGLVRKDRERYASAKELVATFFPDGHVQDRVVAWFPWWYRFGRHLLDRLIEEIEPDSDAFKIVPL